MSSSSLFRALWSRFDSFEFAEEQTQYCKYAQSLLDWANRELDLSEAVGIVGLNQAKVILVDKYFEYFCIVPKRHRYHLSPSGHTCIFQVYLELYQRLKASELALSPPKLFLPSPPRPMPQIAGIFLGEEE